MITITGSKLQTLIYGWAAIVGLVVLRDTNLVLAIAFGIVGAALSLAVALRRVELGDDTVTARSILGSSEGARHTVVKEFGHRYLKLSFEGGRTHRIEVPVEVRPNVRDWVDGV